MNPESAGLRVSEKNGITRVEFIEQNILDEENIQQIGAWVAGRRTGHASGLDLIPGRCASFIRRAGCLDHGEQSGQVEGWGTSSLGHRS